MSLYKGLVLYVKHLEDTFSYSNDITVAFEFDTQDSRELGEG